MYPQNQCQKPDMYSYNTMDVNNMYAVQNNVFDVYGYNNYNVYHSCQKQQTSWNNQFYGTNKNNCYNGYSSCKYNNDWYYNEYPSCSQTIQQNSDFGNVATTSEYYPTAPFQPVNPIGCNQEDTNEESDIIVEESDDDVTDYSEDTEGEINKCVVCNVTCAAMGAQFYVLTPQLPLTMSSQKPVYNKILESMGVLNGDKNYLCSECLGLINTIDHLRLKLNAFQKEFEDKLQIKKPIKKTKLKLPRFKCKKCHKILDFHNYCLYHKKRHKYKPHSFLCELCGLTFKKLATFKTHKLKHNKLKCSNCDKQFKTKSNLKEHQNFCLGLLPFKCSALDCDKKFPTSTKLKNHVKLKHDKKFVAICSICNIGFVKLSDYKSHKISHSTDKKFSCTKCDKSYKTLSNLNFHMKVHSNKLPFNCSSCSKGFLRKEYLEAHLNNHNNIKNFSCSVCKKKFVSQKNLDAHFKYHDGSLKKNTCNVCGKTMTSGFEDHLRTHNNLKEFECSFCDMRFNTKGTLNKHIKIKHVNEEIKIL